MRCRLCHCEPERDDIALTLGAGGIICRRCFDGEPARPRVVRRPSVRHVHRARYQSGRRGHRR
jgi:hypothetical protein